MSVRPRLFTLCFALCLASQPAVAAPPVFDGGIDGLELAAQSTAGAAIFIFGYEGPVNGRTRHGWGWIAVNHEELPGDAGESSAITGGVGEIYIGFIRYQVSVTGGLLTLTNHNDPDVFDDDFDVVMNVGICNFFGQCGAHAFAGELSHVPLIPTIRGALLPGAL